MTVQSSQDAMEASGFASYEAILKEVSNTNTAISKLSLSKSATKCSEEFPIEEAVSEEWLESIRARKKELQTKRQERQLHHKEMSQRKSAASHKRMKIISQLADDTITSNCQCTCSGMSVTVLSPLCREGTQTHRGHFRDER